MLTLPRASARAFRAVLRKCVPPRSRATALPVLLHADADGTFLLASTGEVTLRLALDQANGDGSLLLPLTLLAEVEGSAESVEFTLQPKGQAVARWSDRGGARELAVEPRPAKETPLRPALPDRWGEAEPALLAALHQAGQQASREPGRYDTHRIQIRGDQGQILGTNCHEALIQGGFTFPFPEILHIPAVPVFAAKELADLPLRIGRTNTHLVVEAGPWMVWFQIDPSARYPEVEAAVPKARGTTTVTLAEADAARLAELLPPLPGHDQEAAPITLDCSSDRIVLRRREKPEDTPGEVILTGSTVTGPAMRIALDRRILLRALAHGGRRLRLVEAGRPWAALAEGKIFLAASLDPSEIIGPVEAVPSTALVPVPVTAPAAVPQPVPTVIEFLSEAEGLGQALVETGQRAGRLIALIKTRLKDERGLHQLWNGLKSLPLAGGPSP